MYSKVPQDSVPVKYLLKLMLCDILHQQIMLTLHTTSFAVITMHTRHLGTAGLILPVGYPDSVTPDYLAYQLWAVPSHITGWMGSSLITSSLLAAVGLKAGAGTAAAGAASIRWITKDGIGALGRLLVRQLVLKSPKSQYSL